MPLPRWVARLNRRVTNRLMTPAARNLPGFGLLLHPGRRTGRTHRVPVNVFRCDGGYVFALVYGEEADWVRNVLAAHGAVLERRSESTPLSHPRIVDAGDVGHCVPSPVLRVLDVIGVHRFLVMERSGEAAA